MYLKTQKSKIEYLNSFLKDKVGMIMVAKSLCIKYTYSYQHFRN